MAKISIKNFGGLEWLTVTHIPAKKTKFGDGIESQVLKKIEETVAIFIVKNRVPIRGLEVLYLRKTFGYSLGRMGAELGFSSTAILKWERAQKKHLDKVNEIALRTWAADKLNLDIPGRFSKLISIHDEQEPVKIKAA